jgi:hypothetical protein
MTQSFGPLGGPITYCVIPAKAGIQTGLPPSREHKQAGTQFGEPARTKIGPHKGPGRIGRPETRKTNVRHEES